MRPNSTREGAGIRIIVTFEDGFRAYRGALSAAIRILRPDTEVMTVEPAELIGAVKRLGPDLVIGNWSDEADLEGVPAWIELSLDPARSTKVKVNGDYSEIVNPTLDKLLVILDEVAQNLVKRSR